MHSHETGQVVCQWEAVVEPAGARHSGRFAATDVGDDDFDTAHDSPSLVDAGPSQQFGRFTALAEPTSVDVVHLNLTDGEVGALSDTESNRTVLADGWDDDPAEEDDRMSEADVGFVGGAEEFEEKDVPSGAQGWPL